MTLRLLPGLGVAVTMALGAVALSSGKKAGPLITHGLILEDGSLSVYDEDVLLESMAGYILENEAWALSPSDAVVGFVDDLEVFEGAEVSPDVEAQLEGMMSLALEGFLDSRPEAEEPLPPLPDPPAFELPAPEIPFGENVYEVGAGVEVRRALSPEGQLSGQPMTLFVVYEPDYPRLQQLINTMGALAVEFPDLSFMLVSADETRAAFGGPQKNSIGYAVNMTDAQGRFYALDYALQFPFQGPYMPPEWEDELFDFALGRDYRGI